MNVARLLVAAFAIAAGAAANASAILLSSVPAQAAVGSALTFGARIEAVADLYAFQLDLKYSPNRVRLDAVLEGVGFQTGGGFFSGLNDPASGTVSFVANSLLGLQPGLNGDLDLVRFMFTALEPGTAIFELANVVLLDSSLNEIIPASMAGGQTVIVGSGGTVPEPSTLALVAAAALVTLAGLRGRVNRGDIDTSTVMRSSSAARP